MLVPVKKPKRPRLKYQIDEASIATADATRAECIAEDSPLWSGTRIQTWTGVLANGLSKIHGCACVAGRTPNAVTYRVAGRPSDVAIVRYLFAWLTVEIARLAQRESGRCAMNSFKVGAAQGVINAMRLASQFETEDASVAMVLTSRADESLDFLKKSLGGTARATNGRVSDVGAFDRGMDAGSNLRRSPGLEHRPGVPLLGR